MRGGGISAIRRLAPSLAKSAAMRQNVQQNVPWNLEGLDPDTRDAAREAARRAGMSLDEWLAVTISDRASRVFADTSGAQQPVRRRSAAVPSYDELDAIAAKINKVTRSKAATSSRALDTVMTTVSAEADRRARENAGKTAEALDSVARWIERAEDRMSESTRAVSEGTRMAMERQERTANVLGEALGLMTKRLDEIERKVVDGHQPSVLAALKAVEKVEHHLAKLGETQRPNKQNSEIQNALRGFEERIAGITDKIAETSNRAIGRRGLSMADEVKGAVAEIRSRQALLDGDAMQRSHNDILKALRGDIAKLAGQLDSVRPDHAREERTLAELRREIGGLQGQIGGLASRDEIARLERTLSELTQEAVRAADAGRSKELDALNQVIARVETELGGLSKLVAGGVHQRIAKDYQSLSDKIDAIADSGVDPQSIRTMMRELEAIRVVFSELADPDRVQDLSDQVRELSRQVGQMARSQVDAIEFATLRSAVDDIRGAVKASRASQADADQMVDQFRQLTAKLDELPDRIPQADLHTLSNQYENVAQQIAILSAEQPRQQIARLSDQVESMASKLEEMSGQLTRAQAQAMAHEIEAMSIDLTRLPQPDKSLEIHAINRQFEALAAKVDSLVARPVVADLSPVARQIEALERKLEASWSARDEPQAPSPEILGRLDALTQKLEAGWGSRDEQQAPSPEILGRLDALTRKLEESWSAKEGQHAPSPEILGRLDALTSKLDRFGNEPRSTFEHDFRQEFKQLQRNLENALVTSQSATPVGFETLIERIDRLDEKMRQPQERDDLKPLEDMLSQLAAKLDAAERPNAGLDTVDALEGQIAEIMKRLELSQGSDPALSSLERSMSDLMSQIEVMRDGAVEAAERAARAAIVDTLDAFPRDEARGAEELDFLTRSLIDLKVSQTEAERRSIDKMGSVQETLDKLVERLASLEDGRRPQVAAAGASAQQKSAAPEVAVKLPRTAEFDGGRTALDRSAVKSLENAAKAHLAAAGGRPALDEADKPIGGTGSLGGDVLLEPGSGRPRIDLGRGGHADPEDASDIKASFIAAARRAAQSAAAEAAAAASENVTPHNRETLSRNASDPSGLAGRMRQMIASKRRPLLMGVAAILLAIGAFQMSARFLVETKEDAVAEAAPVSGQITGQLSGQTPRDTADSGLPAFSPRLEAQGRADGPADGRAGPATTSSIDINSLLADGNSLGNEPVVIGADDFISGGAKADADAPLLPPRRGDAETGASAESVSARQLFPSIVSADEIPESTGPVRLREAVLAGDIHAVYELASRAADGRGIVRDQKLAARLFERAAAHGLVPAQYRIGNHYEKGLGVTRDFSLAALWYQRAAESGNARAMHNLAVLLAEGVNGSPDYEAAVGWFSRAAEYGVRDSQYNLAVLLARGLGAQQDLSGSYVWFAIAAAQGDEDAAAKRDEVAGRLSGPELALARAKVEIWRAKAPSPEANDVALPSHGWNDVPARQAGGDVRG
jgi:localization factor PodJL